MDALFHVSEQPGISMFEPRLPPTANPQITAPVVWAVDQTHLQNYLLPRECPRVAFRCAPGTSAMDRERFFPVGDGEHTVVAIESAWFSRAVTSTLWIYEFSPAPFVCADSTAGYFVAPVAVLPTSCRQVDNPLAALVATGAELRVMPSLLDLAAAVAGSSLAFSCIRMRNAQPNLARSSP